MWNVIIDARKILISFEGEARIGTWDDSNPIEIADEGTRIAPEKNDRLVMLGMTFILECPSYIPKRRVVKATTCQLMNFFDASGEDWKSDDRDATLGASSYLPKCR